MTANKLSLIIALIILIAILCFPPWVIIKGGLSLGVGHALLFNPPYQNAVIDQLRLLKELAIASGALLAFHIATICILRTRKRKTD